MRVTRLQLRDFRSYERGELRLGPGLTVVAGPNGAGKTNLLEALYFACTGRSCKTANEREVVRFGAPLTRLVLEASDERGGHEITVGFQPGEAKKLRVDGAAVERLTDVAARPLVSVFLPDRLELVLGAPTLRRAHLDQVVAALSPARTGTWRAYARASSPTRRTSGWRVPPSWPTGPGRRRATRRASRPSWRSASTATS